MEYQVRESDTLERIAACHDCTVGELVKLNKMASRMVFPGQKIRVPVPQDPSTTNRNPPTSPHISTKISSDGYTLVSTTTSSITSPPQTPTSPNYPSTDIIKPPGFAVRQTSITSSSGGGNNNPPSHQASITSTHGGGHADPEDTDCLRRFLKVKVKQVTESDGTVTGTLLITPNCVMFDPDLIHPLVKENGPDLYGMVANMDDIVSVSVFKHDHSLVPLTESQSSEPKKVSFDYGPTEDEYKIAHEELGEVFNDNYETGSTSSGDTYSGGGDGYQQQQQSANPPLTLNMSIDPPPQLPSIEEESQVKSTPTPDQAPSNDEYSNSLHTAANLTKRRAISDAGVIPNDPETNSNASQESNVTGATDNINVPDRPRAHSDLQPSTSLDSQQQKGTGFSRFSPSMTRRSFGRLGRTLSNRANSLKGTVTSGAQIVASNTQKVTHGVVTHTKSAAGHIQSGIETGVKTVAAVPSSIVNVGTEILQEGQDFYGSFVAELKGEQPKSPVALKREKSLATLESLRQKTHEARMTSINQNNIDSVFTKASCETNNSNDLFQNSMDSMAMSNHTPIIGTPPDPPYYMTIRVDRKRMTKKKRINYEDALSGSRHASVSSASDDISAFGNRRRCEFWFAIPRTSADAIYHFLLIWSPGHHQSEETETANATSGNNITASSRNNSLSTEPTQATATAPAVTSQLGIGNKKGLIVLDSHSDDLRIASGGRLDRENWFGATFGSGLVREWEIITVRELCRRLSLDQEYDLAEIPLPEGSTQSQILDEFMIRQIAEILPPRAEGYPWVLIYNSEKHGFSLATLYRKMETWYEEMSPILLIIRDTQGHVFGAMVSTAIRPSDHYYGTADSCFLFRFTGKVPHTRELRHYEWTGDNQFFINSTRETLSIGAGQGHSGLWLDADLNHGRSQRCKTFDNEPLAGGDDEDFIIQFVEAFGFSMS